MILFVLGESVVDPGVTSRFLQSRESVLHAEAWAVGSTLYARVVVDCLANIAEDDLLEACIQEIGLTYTPKSITLERANQPAA